VPQLAINPDPCRTAGIEFADTMYEIGCADDSTS
jgi:hypothetical protein